MIALVTGSAGFLGRHFCTELERRDWQLEDWDIVEGRDVRELFRDSTFRFDMVVHCAAVSPHRSAIDGSALAVGAGCLELDAAMFQWAARTKPGRVVYFSSSAAYPTHLQTGKPTRLTEDMVGEFAGVQGVPDAIYGELKLMGERLAEAYRQQGGKVTVLRPFSGYGELQSADFPFGAFRGRAKRRDNPFAIWGDGSQVRDWVHVDDVVGATLAAVEHDVDGPVNLCTGRGVNMMELARMFTAEAGYDPPLLLQPDKPAGVAYRVGDPTKLHEFYTPTVTLEQGVKRALA
ncbi:MAG TPA: NAD(P)-dependent oxidoreductase [Streptosporangiaceae bacterium]